MTIDTTLRYCPICDADVEMPADTLKGMAAAPKLMAEAFREGRVKPAEGWSAGEIAVHLADVEVSIGWRIRQMLASDDPELQPFDQEAWAAATRYRERDPNLALAAFAALRAANVELLGLLPEQAWERTARHPEFGRPSLRTLVQHISDHDLVHLKQMRESR